MRSSGSATAAIAALCLSRAAAFAAIGEVQATGSNTQKLTTSALSVTLPAPTDAGNTGVFVMVAGGGTFTATVADNAPGGGSSWGLVASTANTLNQQIALWVTPPSGLAPGATVVTVTLDGGSGVIDAEYAEYSGVKGLGDSTSDNDAGATATVSLPTQDPGNWLVAGFGAHGSATYSPSVGALLDQEITNTTPVNTLRSSALSDGSAAVPGLIAIAVTLTVAEPWSAVGVELRTVAPDGGTGFDAGASRDAGVDSGAPLDSGNASDAQLADAGAGESQLTVGCGCRQAGALLWLSALGVLALRRRATCAN